MQTKVRQPGSGVSRKMWQKAKAPNVLLEPGKLRGGVRPEEEAGLMAALPESGGHCPGSHREMDSSPCLSKLCQLDLEALLEPPNTVCYMGSFTSKHFCLPRWG